MTLKKPGSPNQDTRSLVLAVVLSLAVVVGWQYFVEAPKTEAAQKAAAIAAAAETVTPDTAPVAASAPAAEVAPVAPRSRDEVLSDSQRLTIKSDNLHGSIALKGSRLDDLTLAQYHETVDNTSPEIVLLNPTGTTLPYYAEYGWRADAGVKVPDQNSVWKVASGHELSPDHPVVLRFDNGAGLVFEKTFALDDKYMLTITQKVTNNSGAEVSLYPYSLIAREVDPKHGSIYIQHEGPIGVIDGDLVEDKYKDIAKSGVINRTTTGGWFGVTDKYWLVAMVPDQKAQMAARTLQAPQVSANRYQVDLMGQVQKLASGTSLESSSHLFAGAKELAVLEDYAEAYNIPQFHLAIDFGWYSYLTVPFFRALDFLAGLFGNFGLGILAFTVIVKALLFPLADHSYRSMAKIKLVAPKMNKIKETYAGDQQRQSQEMMALYKQEGINPMSGCWPVLIQIPIFFSLYKVLYVSIEMRHAPFYGWIRDLSAADPTNLFTLFGLVDWTPIAGLHIGILPILMGVTMWLQMKMSPPPTDPAQKMIFGFMPLIMTFSMAQFAVGLVIYWTWSNILSIGQQAILNRRMHVKPF